MSDARPKYIKDQVFSCVVLASDNRLLVFEERLLWEEESVLFSLSLQRIRREGKEEPSSYRYSVFIRTSQSHYQSYVQD